MAERLSAREVERMRQAEGIPRSLGIELAMSCPECGQTVIPFAGFGERQWASIGKYRCRPVHGGRRFGIGCNREWLGDPTTGEIVARDRRGRIANRRGHRNVVGNVPVLSYDR